MHVRISDNNTAVSAETDGVDVAARAKNAVRYNEAVGNAGRHIKKRAVHASDQAEIFIFQIGCDLAHRASAVKRRAIDHHRTDGEVGFVCKHVLLQEVLRPVRRFLRMGHFNQIDARSQRHRPFYNSIARNGGCGNGKQTDRQTQRQRTGDHSFHMRPPLQYICAAERGCT